MKLHHIAIIYVIVIVAALMSSQPTVIPFQANNLYGLTIHEKDLPTPNVTFLVDVKEKTFAICYWSSPGLQWPAALVIRADGVHFQRAK